MKSALALLTLLYGCAFSCLAQDQDNTAQPLQVILIGTVSGQLDTVNEFEPFTAYLSGRLPQYRFEMVPLANIDELIHAAEAQELDFAFITPAAYVELTLEKDMRTLATITQMAGDSPSPWLTGAVFTLANRSDINALQDARDKRVVALSELALGGWLSAVREWRSLSIDTEKDLASLEFVFSYSSLIEEVCSGQADIGVIAAGTFNDFSSFCDQPLKVLPPPPAAVDPRYPLPHSTRLYPEVAFAMVRDQDENFVRQLTQALLAIEPGSRVANAVNIGGFTSPLLYTEVREMMQELRLGPFTVFSQLTITQALQQNVITVVILLMAVVILTTLGFIRARILGRKYLQSENYRKQVFEGSHNAMVVMDPETFRFLDLNPAAIRLYGYKSREEVVNLTPFDVSAEKQNLDGPVPGAIRQIKDRVMNEGTAEFEWRHRRKSGEIWDGKVHLMTFSSGGKKLIQATIEDITEKKQLDEKSRELESQLEYSQRMESIGRLAGGIAHDFNNLLTVINGYSDMLIADTGDIPALQSGLKQIRNAGIRASELTSQLLTISRRRITQPVTVNLNSIVMESKDMISSLLGEEISLELNLSKTRALILADTGQVHQVLLNLLVNAKDAMPNGGILRIATECRRVTAEEAARKGLPTENIVSLVVADNGIGMERAIMDHIFEPFFSTKGESGTGLGLATVYGIVSQSHGVITVESQVGAGTTFTITFPASESFEQDIIEDSPDALKAPRPLTILVVEDEEDVKELSASVLEKSGYKVFAFNSAHAALAFLDSSHERIDLLMTDVVMKDMNGRELAEEFMNRYPHTKILFTSGYADDEITRRGIQHGNMEFLEKPYLPKTLLAKLAAVTKDIP